MEQRGIHPSPPRADSAMKDQYDKGVGVKAGGRSAVSATSLCCCKACEPSHYFPRHRQWHAPTTPMLDCRNDGRRSHKGGSSEDCRLQRRQERQRRGRRPATVREGNSGTAREAQLDRSEAPTHPNAAIPAARQRRKQRDEPPELKLTPTTNTHTREHRGEGGTGMPRPQPPTPRRQATWGGNGPTTTARG